MLLWLGNFKINHVVKCSRTRRIVKLILSKRASFNIVNVR